MTKRNVLLGCVLITFYIAGYITFSLETKLMTIATHTRVELADGKGLKKYIIVIPDFNNQRIYELDEAMYEIKQQISLLRFLILSIFLILVYLVRNSDKPKKIVQMAAEDTECK